MRIAAIVTASVLAALLLVFGVLGVATLLMHPRHDHGLTWTHDHGSTYRACTSDGYALLRDTSTGAVTVQTDPRCEGR